MVGVAQLLGIAGFKNSGKTTLVARLIPALGARGISVSTVKHVHHAIDLDEPGKDTFVHREAGAVDVVMLSDARWAILHERRDEPDPLATLGDVVRRLSPVDLVLVEGLKGQNLARIEIRADGDAVVAPGGTVLAVVTDGMPAAGLPSFRRDDVAAIADFIAGLVGRGALAWQ
jgi:molybdopterin-guanine dinucleotide biosynthesis protein B